MTKGVLSRVAVLVDGFNLYHGLRASTGYHHLWLDLQALSESLLKPDQVLVAVHYFTSMVRDDPAGLQRQDVYLQALTAHCDRLEIHQGRFQQRRRRCTSCGTSQTSYEEKESDVALAALLIELAAEGRIDTVLMVSGDADFVPAIHAARRVNAGLRVVAVFPPRRPSDALKAASHAWMNLGAGRIRSSQLPPIVDGAMGPLLKPTHWAAAGASSP